MKTILFSLDKIRIDPDMERQKIGKYEPDKYSAIKKSVENEGLKEDLIGYLDRGKLFLCDGYKRVNALKELKTEGKLPGQLDINSLKCRIISKPEKYRLRYMGNIRQDLAPSVKAYHIKTLMREGMRRDEIAMACGCSIHTLGFWLSVGRLIKPLQDLMDNKRLLVSSAPSISAFNEYGQQQLFNEIKDSKCIGQKKMLILIANSPNKYFTMGKKQREKLREQMKSKTGRKTPPASEKNVLSKTIFQLYREEKRLENEAQSFMKKNIKLLTWIEKALRIKEIESYIKEKHKGVFRDFDLIINAEMGRKREV